MTGLPIFLHIKFYREVISLTNSLIRRGEIYYVDFGTPIGSEQRGIHPALVIQNNVGNRYSPTVIVAPILGRPRRLYIPTHILIHDCTGLATYSMAILEQIRTVDKSRLQEYVGAVDERTLIMIDKALEISLGLGHPRSLTDEITLCLCPICVAQFYNSKEHTIHRTDLTQTAKELCAYCQVRYGYDYTIKNRNEDRSE